MHTINILLFDGFTALDALGPAEIFGHLKDEYTINYFSIEKGIISGSAGIKVITESINEITSNDILLIPGGLGTRDLVNDQDFINNVRALAEKSEIVFSVCTGTALLAKAGLLKNRKATSNKKAWDWVISQDKDVNWIRKARWVIDGKFYTSSGVTAGIDMALGFIANKHNYRIAKEISNSIEYIWNERKEFDPFA